MIGRTKVMKKKIHRREFIRNSICSVAGISLGATALTTLPRRVSGANEKVVLALIGCGGRGSQITKAMAQNENVEVKYACDVDSTRGDGFIKDMDEIQGYAPKRIVEMKDAFDDKDVDAVVIATPEHWHALATVRACQAGKDVYVEKNISKTIWESRKMIETAEKYKRIVQCGTQNRSAPYGFSARQYIQSGKLGRVVHVKCYCMLPGSGGWQAQPDSAVPDGLDWDRWLGPAPQVPYNKGRHRGWYSWWDYSGGIGLAGDASHVMDLARMAISDPAHPKSVYCAGGNNAYPSQRQTPDIQVITYDYSDFTMTCESSNFGMYLKKSQGDVRYGKKFPDWRQNSTRIEIYGTKRMMYLGRHGGGWQVLEGDGKVVDFEYGYFPDEYHQKNFIESVRSRKQPNGNIVQGHLSACLVHLGNAAYRSGNIQLCFDSGSETFTNNEEANELLKPAYRKQYRIPEKV